MLAYAVKILVQRRAIAVLSQAIQALLAARADWAADMDGMRVDDEKGGSLSSAIWQNTPHNLAASSVSSARRSANFWRVISFGNELRMSG